MRLHRALAVTTAIALTMTACGGDSEPETVPSQQDTTAATEDGKPDTSGAASSRQDARAAVIQIVAEGTFTDPEFGLQLNAAGSGSGFFISSDGIAVTNNHVVTGAALLQVYVDGEDEPRNARVLGVSECSDLAVIDVEGDGYPFLAFADESAVGTDVFALGFPLGDPEFTMTGGIISKEEADGESSWASVDHVIEHDANINPGNSGGPLIDDNGRVVGINYAGNNSTDQEFAIAAGLAQPIIDDLRNETDVHSIGVNGEAVYDSTSDLAGVWVASVASGSPADEAGIQAGDIITRLEGLLIATDGTMADYCDVLRSHSPDDQLKIEVLRYATEEVLEGELNGDPLEQSFSFAQEYEDQVGDGGQGQTYDEYVNVMDDLGVISVDLPASWSEVDGAENPDFGPSIWAAPNLDAFSASWSEPGMIVEASQDFGPADADSQLDSMAESITGSCVSGGRDTYEDPLYAGALEVFTDCDGTSALVITVAAAPDDGSFLIRLIVQVNSDADLDAVDRILDTFVATF